MQHFFKNAAVPIDCYPVQYWTLVSTERYYRQQTVLTVTVQHSVTGCLMDNKERQATERPPQIHIYIHCRPDGKLKYSLFK